MWNCKFKTVKDDMIMAVLTNQERYECACETAKGDVKILVLTNRGWCEYAGLKNQGCCEQTSFKRKRESLWQNVRLIFLTVSLYEYSREEWLVTNQFEVEGASTSHK